MKGSMFMFVHASVVIIDVESLSSSMVGVILFTVGGGAPLRTRDH